MTQNSPRRLRAAAFGALLLGLTGVAALGQETNTVGPPQLKDFQLPGQRTTPPAEPPSQPTATVGPSTQPPASQPATRPRANRPAAGAVGRGATATPSPRPAVRTAAPAPRPAAPTIAAPGTTAPPPSTVQPLPAPDLPRNASPQPSPAPQAHPQPSAEPGFAFGWPWLALPVALALLGFVAWRRRRVSVVDEETIAEDPVPVPADAVAAPDVQDPAAAVAEPPRARLEVEFRPDRAAATDAEAVVQFELTVRNLGDSRAGNIRIDTRMFNADAEAEIDAFLQGPIHAHSGSPHVSLAPGESLSLNGAIAMPKAELREIHLEGRRLFVPVVAVNVAYVWSEGAGRTSRSWLVGREPETPSAKMGAFRLDLGPRIYRSVGQRPTRLAHVA